jgi:hypothetical protein
MKKTWAGLIASAIFGTPKTLKWPPSVFYIFQWVDGSTADTNVTGTFMIIK